MASQKIIKSYFLFIVSANQNIININRRLTMQVKDTTKILSIATSIAALFNFNNIQKSQLNMYVKNNMYEWIEKRKTEAEVESLITSEAQNIE